MWIAIITCIVAVVGMVLYRLLMPQEYRQVSSGTTVSRSPKEQRQLLSGTIASKHRIRLIMMVAVSVVVLVASLYVILSGGYDEGTQKWAFGAVGSLIGFWIKD